MTRRKYQSSVFSTSLWHNHRGRTPSQFLPQPTPVSNWEGEGGALVPLAIPAHDGGPPRLPAPPQPSGMS